MPPGCRVSRPPVSDGGVEEGEPEPCLLRDTAEGGYCCVPMEFFKLLENFSQSALLKTVSGFSLRASQWYLACGFFHIYFFIGFERSFLVLWVFLVVSRKRL